MSENITIHDVAAEAGVSIATVSRVLNNMESVKDSTRERVYEAMRVVGYPIPEPKAAETKKNRTILIMVTNIGNQFTGKEVEGIFSEAYNNDYDCVIYRQKNENYTYEDIRRVADEVNAGGIIMSLPNVPADIMNQLSECYPVVQFSEYVEDCAVPFVSVNDYAVGKQATKYLLRMGKRRIALFNGPKRFKYARERERGYLDALKEEGIAPNPELIVSTVVSQGVIQATASKLVKSSLEPDAVVAVSDGFAAAVIAACHSVGMCVPKDLAVISCEDTNLAQMLVPPLTTVSQPIFHIGKQACQMLLSLMDGNQPEPSQVFLESQLVVRESS